MTCTATLEPLTSYSQAVTPPDADMPRPESIKKPGKPDDSVKVTIRSDLETVAKITRWGVEKYGERFAIYSLTTRIQLFVAAMVDDLPQPTDP